LVPGIVLKIMGCVDGVRVLLAGADPENRHHVSSKLRRPAGHGPLSATDQRHKLSAWAGGVNEEPDSRQRAQVV